MKKIETSVSVARDGRLELDEPVRTDLPPGRHRAVMLVEDEGASAPAGRFDWQEVDWSGWPVEARFGRSELYGNRQR